MKQVTPEVIKTLATFLDLHTSVSEHQATRIVRAIADGQAVTLPQAIDWLGEVLRAQLSVMLPSISAPQAAVAIVPVEPAPTAEPAAQAIASDYEARVRRARILCASAGREALADRLVSSSLTADEALMVLWSSPSQVFPREVLGGGNPTPDAARLRQSFVAALENAAGTRNALWG